MKYFISFGFVLCLFINAFPLGDSITLPSYWSTTLNFDNLSYNLSNEYTSNNEGVVRIAYKDSSKYISFYLKVKKNDTAYYPGHFKIYCYNILNDTIKIINLGPCNLSPIGTQLNIQLQPYRTSSIIDTITYWIKSYREIDSSFELYVGSEKHYIKVKDTLQFTNGALIFFDWAWKDIFVSMWVIKKPPSVNYSIGYNYSMSAEIDTTNLINGYINDFSFRVNSNSDESFFPFGVVGDFKITFDDSVVLHERSLLNANLYHFDTYRHNFVDSAVFDLKIDPDNLFSEPNEIDNYIYIVYKKANLKIITNNTRTIDQFVFKNSHNKWNLLGQKLNSNMTNINALIVSKRKKIVNISR